MWESVGPSEMALLETGGRQLGNGGFSFQLTRGPGPATRLRVLRYLAVALIVSCKSVTRYPLKIKKAAPRYEQALQCPVRGCNEGISPPQVCSICSAVHSYLSREAPPSSSPTSFLCDLLLSYGPRALKKHLVGLIVVF